MDKNYINEIIRRIEQEKAEHTRKFAGNAAHKNCSPRFDNVIANLKLELAKANNVKESASEA